MSNKRIGIIGFGEMGKRHGLDMEELSRGRIKVEAVYEPDDNKYELGCEWLRGKPERFDTVPELLSKAKPDGVIIASPNATHLDNLRFFEGMDIPILLEKPLDTGLDKVSEVLRFVKKYQGPVPVHHVMRYAPIVRKAKELIEQGRLGDVKSFSFQQTIGGGMFHNFRRNLATGGGQLLEKATHDFDVLLYLLESVPVKVNAICRQQRYGGDKPDDLRCGNCEERFECSEYYASRDSRGFKDVDPSDDLCCFSKCVDVPDNEVCMLELADGTFGTYSNCYFVSNYFSRVYEVIGDCGIMRICFSMLDKNSSDGEILVSSREGRERFGFNYHGRIHYNGAPDVVKHFHSLMCGEKRILSPVDQAFVAEMIAMGAYESNKTGAYVDIAEMVPEDLRETYLKAFE